jgi:MYXO-CTERM domain-containing protein
MSALLVCLCAATIPSPAAAQEDPCGNFDFSAGLDCRIEVEGGCTADCTPMKLEAGCTGQCTASAETQCVDDCGTTCIAMCNPAELDCFVGCHGECDEPVMDQCEQARPGEDCAETARAQCDIHCQEACAVPPNDCQEHCTKCCTGSCTTTVNFDCNLDCFAELQGGCEVQCQQPAGAIFCNGQYVHASDIEECITYLAEQGIQVDVSARGEVTCDLSGCEGSGSASGCSAAPSPAKGAAGLALTLAVLAVSVVVSRRRPRR